MRGRSGWKMCWAASIGTGTEGGGSTLSLTPGHGFPCTVLVTAHCPALTAGFQFVRLFVSSSLQTGQGLSDLHITCPLTGFQHYPYALQHAYGSLSYLYLIPCIPVCGLGKLTAVQSCLLAQKCSSCLPPYCPCISLLLSGRVAPPIPPQPASPLPPPSHPPVPLLQISCIRYLGGGRLGVGLGSAMQVG